MKASGVYMLESPSGKIYIGQSKNIRRRMCEHSYNSKKINNKLYASIKKYGLDMHTLKILFLSDDQYEKDKIEQFYINFYNAINKGLNHIDVIGGVKSFTGKKHTLKEINRIKKRMQGITPEWAIAKIRKTIFCGYNNKKYNSISECARDLNVSQPLISMMLNKKRKNKYKVERI